MLKNRKYKAASEEKVVKWNQTVFDDDAFSLFRSFSLDYDEIELSLIDGKKKFDDIMLLRGSIHFLMLT